VQSVSFLFASRNLKHRQSQQLFDPFNYKFNLLARFLRDPYLKKSLYVCQTKKKNDMMLYTP